jgi:pantetheine-phosphate adenylyltransferase
MDSEYTTTKQIEGLTRLSKIMGNQGIMFDQFRSRWYEPHRHYHDEKHLRTLIGRAVSILPSGKYLDNLLLAIMFHDIVYNPWKNDNEEESAKVFSDWWAHHPQKNEIVQAILETKTHRPVSDLGIDLCRLDMEILDSDWPTLIEYEHGIFKEYQFADLVTYKTNRVKFLRDNIIGNRHLNDLADYVENRIPNIAVFPGSFNPYHIGHEEVRQSAAKIFDKVIIAVGINSSKANAQFDDLHSVQKQFPQYQVDHYNTLLSEYVKSLGYPVTIVRGLRNGEDFGYEQRNLRFLQDMNPDTNIIYIPSSSKTEHISSSAIREISKFDKKSASRYLL